MASTSSLPFPFLFFFLVLLSTAEPPREESGKCSDHEEKALLTIYAHFNFHFQFSNTSSCCDWYGVECDPNDHGRVISLVIDRDNNISGTISPAIGDLPHLTRLRLQMLPSLAGSIPPSITNLTNLTILDLSWNSLSGPVPSFLSQLNSLKFLALNSNKFTGSIPPSLSTLPKLVELHLDHNHLTGPIPDSFGSFNAASPLHLYLSDNNLSGPIPASLGRVDWETIDISRNKLRGDASVLFGSSKNTEHIDISRNRFEFELTRVRFPASLQWLDMNHNFIYGEIPSMINELTDLVMFNVSYNRLCGKLPAGNVTAEFVEECYFHNKCLCGDPLPVCK